MDDNELPVWMKRKESAQENTAAEPSTIVSNQKPNVKLRWALAKLINTKPLLSLIKAKNLTRRFIAKKQ